MPSARTSYSKLDSDVTCSTTSFFSFLFVVAACLSMLLLALIGRGGLAACSLSTYSEGELDNSLPVHCLLIVLFLPFFTLSIFASPVQYYLLYIFFLIYIFPLSLLLSLSLPLSVTLSLLLTLSLSLSLSLSLTLTQSLSLSRSLSLGLYSKRIGCLRLPTSVYHCPGRAKQRGDGGC